MGISNKKNHYALAGKNDVMRVLAENIRDFAKSHDLSLLKKNPIRFIDQQPTTKLACMTIHTFLDEKREGENEIIALVMPQGVDRKNSYEIHMTAVATCVALN